VVGSLPSQPKRRGLIVSIGLNIALVLLVCGLVLYAFMLNVDLGDLKRRMSKEVETSQQAERYLVETRNQLTDSLREIEQLKAQLAYKETDYQAAVAAKPALPVVVNFRSSILGKGLVALIVNTSERYLTVMLSVRNPTLSAAKRFKIDLDPNPNPASTSVIWKAGSLLRVTSWHCSMMSLVRSNCRCRKRLQAKQGGISSSSNT